MAGSSSYSTRMSFLACSTTSSFSPTTRAMASPRKWVVSPTGTSTSQSGTI